MAAGHEDPQECLTEQTSQATERTCINLPELVKSHEVGGDAVAVRIETPFPSMREVARTVGVSAERVKEIERLVETLLRRTGTAVFSSAIRQ